MRELGVTYTQQERREIEDRMTPRYSVQELTMLRVTDPTRYAEILDEIVSDPS